MIDYRQFLDQKEDLVLPYFGGRFVTRASFRRLRITSPAVGAPILSPGWWRFQVSGRYATPIEKVDPDPLILAHRAHVRGHSIGDLVVWDGAIPEPVHLIPDDRPARFALITAARWGNDLIFGNLLFETEAEESARRAFEDQRSLREIKGIPATLRAAFGYAIAFDVARRMNVPLAPVEIAGSIVGLAERDDGRVLAELLVNEIIHARRTHLSTAAIPVLPAIRLQREEDIEARCGISLRKGGAELLDLRQMDGELVEVTYRFMAQRFQSIVNRRTLQVIEAGICLSGRDNLATLDTLPAILREAIQTHRLVITRHGDYEPEYESE